MQEVCFCGRSGNLVEREPVQDEIGNWALRCPNPSCDHLDYLEWAPDDVRLNLLDEARRQRTPHSERAPSDRAAD